MIENDFQNEKPNLTATLGGEVRKGWDSTDRLFDRAESFSILKHRTMEFHDWGLDGGIPLFDKSTTKTFRLLRDCGKYLIFRNYLESHRSRLIGACSCKMHLLCAFCASRRGVKNAMAYKEKVVHLTKQTPDVDLMFITFTVKNGTELFPTYSALRSSMRILLARRNQNVNGRGKVKTQMAKLLGGVFAYEVKRGAGRNNWHPHIHMLAHKPKSSSIDIQALKEEWLEITGDSSVINIKYCENDDPFLEVFAYALKFSELEHPDRWHASQVLKGERLISSYGTFRGIDLGDDVTDDILISEEPYVDVLLSWFIHRGYDSPKVIFDSREAVKPLLNRLVPQL